MKAITYKDVLKVIGEKYDTRNKRIMHKENHIVALEAAIKQKIKALNRIHGFGSERQVIDDEAFGKLHAFVKQSEEETALKAKRKKKESTASSDTFKTLSTLLDNSKQHAFSEVSPQGIPESFTRTAAVVENKNKALESGRLSSYAGALHASAPLLAQLNNMLFDAGVDPDNVISYMKNIQEMSKLYQFMNAICHLLLIIKTMTSIDDVKAQGQAVACQLINKVRASDDVSAAEVIFYALSASAKQLFSEEYSRMYKREDRDPAEKLLTLERKFFNESLVKLIETDKNALIEFLEAVIHADADRLQRLVQYFQDPNNIDLRLMNYSLAALTKQVNTGETTQSRYTMRH
jgi:hypothetical protein